MNSSLRQKVLRCFKQGECDEGTAQALTTAVLDIMGKSESADAAKIEILAFLQRHSVGNEELRTRWIMEHYKNAKSELVGVKR